MLAKILFLYLEFEINIDSETRPIKGNSEARLMTKNKLRKLQSIAKLLGNLLFFYEASCDPALCYDVFLSEFRLSLFERFICPPASFVFSTSLRIYTHPSLLLYATPFSVK